jgi:hypothetical protein
MPDDLISQAIALTMLRYNIDVDAAQALVMQLSTHQQQPMTDGARAHIAKFSAPTTVPSRSQPTARTDRRQAFTPRHPCATCRPDPRCSRPPPNRDREGAR